MEKCRCSEKKPLCRLFKNSEAKCASMQCEICVVQFYVADCDVNILGERWPMYGPHASDGGDAVCYVVSMCSGQHKMCDVNLVWCMH